MVEMVRERQAEVEKTEKHDLFSNLLKANDLDSGLLSEDEIISMSLITSPDVDFVTNVPGNIYVFLVAGHEVRKTHFFFAFL